MQWSRLMGRNTEPVLNPAVLVPESAAPAPQEQAPAPAPVVEPVVEAAPATPAPAPAPVVEPAPAPASQAGVDEPAPAPVPAAAPEGLDFTRVIASIVTAASAVFTVWSVWDLARGVGEEGQAAPHAVGLGAGIGVEAVWLWLLAIEWQQASTTGRVAPALTLTGWALAVGAAVVLAVHGVMTSWPMALLAVLPLAAKAGWHWLTSICAERTRARLAAAAAAAKAAQEERLQDERAARAERDAEREREQALSTGLTEAEEAELAQIRRKAAYAKAKAAAEMELTAAEAEAVRMLLQADADADRVRQETEHRMRQEALQRQVEAQMAAQRADADLLKQRFALEQELTLMRPIGAGPAVGGERAPDDASAITGPGPFGAPTAGFGFTVAAGAGGATGATPADLGVPQGATPGATGAAPQQSERLWPKPPTPEQGQRQLVEYAQWQVKRGQAPGIRDAARRMQTSPRSITRYRDALLPDYPELMGYFGQQS